MKTPMERTSGRYDFDHPAIIQRVMRGENDTGFDDAAVVNAHAGAMQHRINELEAEVRALKMEMES